MKEQIVSMIMLFVSGLFGAGMCLAGQGNEAGIGGNAESGGSAPSCGSKGGVCK